jgi:hypothetical protein
MMSHGDSLGVKMSGTGAGACVRARTARKPKRAKVRSGEATMHRSPTWCHACQRALPGTQTQLEIHLRFLPQAKKNRQRKLTIGGVKMWVGDKIMRVGGKSIIANSREVVDDAKMIRSIVWLALQQSGMPWQEDELEATFIVGMRSNTLRVVVRSLGPRPKGFTGRTRDIANIPESVLDALQGIVYANDNQVGLLIVRRLLS